MTRFQKASGSSKARLRGWLSGVRHPLCRCVLWVCGLALLHHCSSPPAASPRLPRQIGYAFYSSLDTVDNATTRLDEVSQGLLDQFHRLTDSSLLFAAWSDWPSPTVQLLMCKEMEAHPRVQLQLIVDPSRVSATEVGGRFPDSLAPIVSHPQVALLNQQYPRAGILNQRVKAAALHSDLFLFQYLRPEGPDDGAFTLLTSDGPFPSPQQPGITEAVRLYGDSILYGRYLAYWQALRDGASDITQAKTHTYSNLHDHQAWFFPDMLAENTSNAVGLLSQLDRGIAETHQPAKVRLVLTGVDLCHLDFMTQLVHLHEQYEADIRVILDDTATISKKAASMLTKLPRGKVRLFPARDSLHRHELSSRFLLIDGPYVVTEDEPVQPRRICIFFGDDLHLEAQRNHSAVWLRIDDKRVFAEAERHWNRIWELAEETSISQAEKIKPHPRCIRK